MNEERPAGTFDAQEILPRLYLGDYEAGLKLEELQRRQISHVLSVCKGGRPLHPELQYHVIQADDSDNEDLISHFPMALAFIDSALDNKTAVLVHCIAGRSRSATIVIAWCMSRLQLDFFDAVAMVRKARSVVSPNPGFTAQLKLFEAMNCALEGSSEAHYEYKRILLAKKAKDLRRTWEGEKPIYLKDLGVIGVATNREHVYVCACCGHILFEKDHIIHEEDGYGDELNRFVLFPMKWMAAKERRELQEKEEGDEGSKEDLDDEENVQVLEAFMADLFCPNADCGKKVGRYCWLGRNCICEQSFNPSFEVEYLAVRNLAS